MALRLYHDTQGLQEVTEANPDRVRKAVQGGQTLADEKVLYLKGDDPDLTYEEVSIQAYGDEGGADEHGEIDVLYALDVSGSPGSYQQVLALPDGDYGQSFPIWRKVVAPTVQAAFRRSDVKHTINHSEYVK